MATEENKAIHTQWVEESWNKQNLAISDELLAPDIVVHGMQLPTPGVEGVKQIVVAFLTAFPDAHMTTDDLIAEGDKVGSRWTFRGTHQGELMGIPPTGKQVTLTGISIDRIVNGNIVERWLEFDQLGLLQQLGAIPPSNQASA